MGGAGAAGGCGVGMRLFEALCKNLAGSTVANRAGAREVEDILVEEGGIRCRARYQGKRKILLLMWEEIIIF